MQGLIIFIQNILVGATAQGRKGARAQRRNGSMAQWLNDD